MQRTDDDHRNAPESWIGLDLGQRFVTVHLGHEDVQKDDIDIGLILVAETFEGTSSVVGLHGGQSE